MTKRSRRFLTILLCAAIGSNFGCTTTTPRGEPPQAAMGGYGTGTGDNVSVGAEIEDLRRAELSQNVMDDYGIEKRDIVLVRYANKDGPRNNPKKKSKLCSVFFKVAATLVQLNNIARGDVTGMMATIGHFRSKSQRKTLQ